MHFKVSHQVNMFEDVWIGSSQRSFPASEMDIQGKLQSSICLDYQGTARGEAAPEVSKGRK